MANLYNGHMIYIPFLSFCIILPNKSPKSQTDTAFGGWPHKFNYLFLSFTKAAETGESILPEDVPLERLNCFFHDLMVSQLERLFSFLLSKYILYRCRARHRPFTQPSDLGSINKQICMSLEAMGSI